MCQVDSTQELLAAEDQASDLLAEARDVRGNRMRQCKSDVRDEAELYRAEKQEAYDKSLKIAAEKQERHKDKIMAQASVDIATMRGQYEMNRNEALEILISKCITVSLDVPAARVRSTHKMYGPPPPRNIQLKLDDEDSSVAASSLSSKSNNSNRPSSPLKRILALRRKKIAA